MPGTRPGMTGFVRKPHFIGCNLSQTLRMKAYYIPPILQTIFHSSAVTG
jgi:hypothetical protein